MMLRKLLSIYEDAVLFSEPPEKPSEQFYIFYDKNENDWVGIPKFSISDKEFTLLKTLYELKDFQTTSYTTAAGQWQEYLFLNGPSPTNNTNTSYRFIQFQINGNEPDQMELESAFKGFFSDEVIIVWENCNKGIIIEEKKQISLSEDELMTASETLESDFFVKISFFLGKLYYMSEQLRDNFQQERDYFTFALARLGNTNLYTFERVFPAYLAYHSPSDLMTPELKKMFDLFEQDPDLFSTILIFLENNLNSSLTAKKLYIHRNTLQYRIDKFVERTGIGLKDFYGAFTVFFACQMYMKQQK